MTPVAGGGPALRVGSIGFGVPGVDQALPLFAGALRGAVCRAGDGAVHVRYPPGTSVRLLTTAAPAEAGLRDVTFWSPSPDAHAGPLRAAGARVSATADGAGLVARHPGLGVDLRIVVPEVADDLDAAAGGALVRGLDHVCIAVPDLRVALSVLRDALGGGVVFGGLNHRMGTVSSQVRFDGGGKVELLQPLRDGVPVARFLARRGPGLHHLTFMVSDVVEAEAAVTGAGFEVVDTDLTSQPHWRETYVRPASAFSALVQLAWSDLSYSRALDDGEVAAIVDRQVDSEGYRMRPEPPER